MVCFLKPHFPTTVGDGETLVQYIDMAFQLNDQHNRHKLYHDVLEQKLNETSCQTTPDFFDDSIRYFNDTSKKEIPRAEFHLMYVNIVNIFECKC